MQPVTVKENGHISFEAICEVECQPETGFSTVINIIK